jgi:hypothetical protein
MKISSQYAPPLLHHFLFPAPGAASPMFPPSIAALIFIHIFWISDHHLGRGATA